MTNNTIVSRIPSPLGMPIQIWQKGAIPSYPGTLIRASRYLGNSRLLCSPDGGTISSADLVLDTDDDKERTSGL
ncbi:hypothetical protein N7468_002487 [Penicillium chermesinum]|uniref:Uncharacterized protein n=1 Tax=Penicillium chermesinum TaxID=63820 RepID=A0A9W9PIK7_9EURO|nr:uncharacterized protein N7468_002487 [Penicillium chermesinum]KAJ5247504.1 hypothetical protein N7468_002487 [Penicillium chermesinum]